MLRLDITNVQKNLYYTCKLYIKKKQTCWSLHESQIVASKKTKRKKEKKKHTRVRRVDFDSRAVIIPTTRIIHKSDCEQPGNGVIRRKSLSLIPHDWSLKCIFFKWNIKKKNIYFYYILSSTHTHASLDLFFIFSNLFSVQDKSAPLFCDESRRSVRLISRSTVISRERSRYISDT